MLSIEKLRGKLVGIGIGRRVVEEPQTLPEVISQAQETLSPPRVVDYLRSLKDRFGEFALGTAVGFTGRMALGAGIRALGLTGLPATVLTGAIVGGSWAGVQEYRRQKRYYYHLSEEGFDKKRIAVEASKGVVMGAAGAVIGYGLTSFFLDSANARIESLSHLPATPVETSHIAAPVAEVTPIPTVESTLTPVPVETLPAPPVDHLIQAPFSTPSPDLNPVQNIVQTPTAAAISSDLGVNALPDTLSGAQANTNITVDLQKGSTLWALTRDYIQQVNGHVSGDEIVRATTELCKENDVSDTILNPGGGRFDSRYLLPGFKVIMGKSFQNLVASFA